MSVNADFFKHKDFGGTVESFNLNGRYKWIKFGSALGNEISSFRAHAYSGNGANVYSFAEKNFLGNYLSLNMHNGTTSWWSWVGSSMNDTIESALMINRSAGETEMEVKSLIQADFIAGMDAALNGTKLSRVGNPRIFSLFFPGHDPSRNFVSIEQDLHVTVDGWFDYSAQVRYDIYLYLNAAGKISGYVAWVYVWVEGGILSGTIFNQIQPKLVAGASTLTTKIQDKLSQLSFLTFHGLYLLPGKKPTASFGDSGNAKDNATLVLVS